MRTVGSGRFRPAQLLEQGAPALGGLDLVIDDTNRATVAWGATTVRAAVTDASATFGAAQDIAPGAEGALASTPDGRRVVAWTSGGALLGARARERPVRRARDGHGDRRRPRHAAFDATGNRWWLVVGRTEGEHTAPPPKARPGPLGSRFAPVRQFEKRRPEGPGPTARG